MADTGATTGTEPAGSSDAATAAAHNQGALAAHTARVASSGQAATAEQALQLPPDGRPALFEVVATPLRDAQDQAIGVVGAARDITLIRKGAQEWATSCSCWM